jgi:signal peptidase I
VQVGQKSLLTAVGPALLADVLRRFGAARVAVAGTSMLPAIRPRDVLVVERRTIHQIQVGDVALFALGHRLFAHRVVRTGVDQTGAPTLVTRGDTHGDEDLPIGSSELLGQVLTVSRNGRSLGTPSAYSRAWSFLALTAVRALQLIRLGPPSWT